jgi:replicative DNA helicase
MEGISVPAAEAAVVGAYLLDAAQAERTAPLAAEDLADTAHRAVFAAIAACREDGVPVDPVTVAEELRRRGQLDGVGGLPALMDYVDRTPTTLHMGHYAAIVRNAALRRRLVAWARQVATAAADPDHDPTAVAYTARTALDTWAGSGDIGLGGVIGQRQAVDDAWAYLQARWTPAGEPIWTPWRRFDAMAGGLARGTLTVLAARTSQGKSSLAVQLATHAARTGHGVLYVSYEMAPAHLVVQQLTQGEGWDRYLTLAGRGPTPDRVQRGLTQLAGLPMYWWRPGDRPRWETVRAALPALTRATPRVDLVVLDHLELVPLASRRDLPAELANLAADIKAAAVREDVAILAVDQLNRAADAQDRPSLGNLGWSSGIEKAADNVWALALVDREDAHGDRWIYVLKHRDGPVGHLRLRWEPAATRFHLAEDGR